jgi:tetratricopeptide (TPR) repeat protein
MAGPSTTSAPEARATAPSSVARLGAGALLQAPATAPQLAALALFVIWATEEGGYPLTHWAPGALIVLGLLVVTVAAAGLRLAEVPRPVQIALACLAAYTALSFVSIIWAGVPGDAWEGANRTLLYLLVFALFACWRQRGGSAALLLAVWTLAIAGLAAFVALHVGASSRHGLDSLLPYGRLNYPTGYVNANAATWLMAFWPALLLARSARLPWALRGALAGGAVLLADVALLGQSRGSLYATPVMLLLVFALVPGRLRTFALLVPVAAAIGATAPAVLRVGNHLSNGEVTTSTVSAAIPQMFAAALAAAAVVALAGAIEQRRRLSPATLARVRLGLTAVALATIIGGLAGGWVAAGDPVARIRHGWDTFKSPRGYGANAHGSRLTSGLGSYRYDFYRVALDEFAAHPVLGIGADNFQQPYLAHARSYETPRYPHSVELRTLTETGLAGALLAIAGLAGALLAAARARRARASTDALAPDVAVAALAGFAYWLVHGSFDWFWEFAGLGAPAFALLGLACALTPRSQAATGSSAGLRAGAPRPGRRAGLVRRARRAGLAAALLTALLAAASLTAPWLSQRQVQSAARIWARAPRAAYARLQDAADLNPLSAEPYLIAGSIALRFEDLPLADRRFAQALARSPGDAYATLERGVIASAVGRRQAALRLLARAARLDPRNGLIRAAVDLVREGRRVNVADVNRSILLRAQELR